VDWTTVEAHIARARVIRVDDSLRPHPDPGRPVRGVALLDWVQARFGSSDRRPARVLGVTPAVASRYLPCGVPDHQASRLRRLSGWPSKQQASPLRGGSFTYTRASPTVAQNGLAGWVRKLRHYPSLGGRRHPSRGDVLHPRSASHVGIIRRAVCNTQERPGGYWAWCGGVVSRAGGSR
jgi:hypothetical protein